MAKQKTATNKYIMKIKIRSNSVETHVQTCAFLCTFVFICAQLCTVVQSCAHIHIHNRYVCAQVCTHVCRFVHKWWASGAVVCTYVHIFVNTCVNKTASHDEGKCIYLHICGSKAVIVHKCAQGLVIRCSLVHSCAQIRDHL